jgi:hypothetical protein
MHENNNYNQNNSAWIAIILSVIALLVALLAYNRTGANIDVVGKEETRELLIDTRLQFARFEAATDLAAIRAKQVTQRNYVDLERDTTEVRQDLANAYREAGRETSEEWKELNATFDQIEAKTRDKSADVLAVIENAIRALKQDIRSDSEDPS